MTEEQLKVLIECATRDVECLALIANNESFDGAALSAKANLAALISELRSARKDAERLRASLLWALEELEDGVPCEPPTHLCAFTVRPDVGRCEFHEAWATARELVGGWPDSPSSTQEEQ